MTGVEAKAAQSGESLTEWDQRTAPKEKAPEAKATDALGELTGLKAGPTEINEDLAEWNRRTQEAKPKPSENWRQNVTKKKAAEIDEAVTMGERRGNKVVVTTEIPGEGRHDADGTIYLNPNAEHPVRQVLVHEFTHDIETSKVYERFSKAVLAIAERIDGADIAQMKEQIRLEEPGLNDPGIERELVARIAGSRLFTDQNMVNRLFKIDQTVFQKVKNWISDALTKAFGSEERKELLRAEKLYLRAMNSRGQVNGVGEGQNFIVTAADGKQYVQADRQIISGNDRGKWKTQLGNFLENKMIRGYNLPVTTADGHILYLTSDTIGKLTSDVKDRAGNLLSDEEFRLKEEVASHIDEIVKVSKFGNHNIDDESHPHEDAWNGWDYYTAYFKDYDGQYYKFKISAKKSDIDTVYNTRNMGIRIPPTNSLTALPDQNDSGALGGGLLNDSRVPQQGEKVNSQNGENFKGSSYEDMLAAQREKLQKNGAKTGVTMEVDDWVGMVKIRFRLFFSNTICTIYAKLYKKSPFRGIFHSSSGR